MRTTEPRLTTAEAASLLHCRPTEALALLWAANTPHTRTGRRGAILWNAAAVDRLLQAIHAEGAAR